MISAPVICASFQVMSTNNLFEYDINAGLNIATCRALGKQTFFALLPRISNST